MARMIPNLPIDENTPNNLNHFNGDVSERAMYRALKEQLPEDWVVRYDYVFCYWRAGRRCPDGQADFIVVAPNYGLMFVEVKGAAGLECRDGQYYWLRDDGSLGNPADNPFEQAQSNKHNIVKILKDSCFGVDFPGCYGHLVAFPRAKGRVPASHNNEIVLCYDRMGELHARILSAFNSFGHAALAVEFNAQRMALVVKKLEDNTRFVPIAAADVDDDERKIDALTRQQWNTFKGILGNQRVRVDGVAGSGKTILALWAAKQFADSGQKVLFLCFNKLLKKWIELSHPASLRIFEVETFHSLVGRFCAESGTPFRAQSAQDWENAAPNSILDAIDRLGDEIKYDVVIVDEAQDFHPQWWTPVEFLIQNKESRLLIFSDPRQRLYSTKQVEVTNVTKFVLSENCRNTKSISSFCGNVVNSPISSFEMAPIGVTPTILQANGNVQARRNAVQATVNTWINEGFSPCRIAILSPWSRENSELSSLKGLASVHNLPVRGGEEGLADWKLGKSIFGETVKAFKGLEADCLVISDIPPIGTKGFDQSDLYVAASRAKHKLALIPTNEAAAEELRAYCDNRV